MRAQTKAKPQGNMYTWYAADAVPKMKPCGKLLRLSEETSRIAATASAKVTDANVLRKRPRRKNALYAISCLCLV